MILLPQKVAYRGTISSLRISSVDGTAFLDNCAALVPYADGNHLIEIYDASGNQLKGYLSAAGDGEDLSVTEINADPGFATATGWTANDGWAVTEGGTEKAVASSGTGAYLYRLATQTAGALYKTTLDIDALGSGALFSIVYNTTPQVGDNFSTTGTKTEYKTLVAASKAAIGLRRTTMTWTGTFDNLSRHQVTGPSTSGCTIVSTKGGATQSFATVQEGFAYNAAAYSVVVRKAR